MDVVFHVGGIAGMGGPWKRLLRDQHPRHAARRRGMSDARRRPAGLHQQPERHVRRPQPGGRRRVGAVSEALALPLLRTRRRWPSSTCWPPTGETGLLTCALRPHLIWGPRDRHLIPRVLERARSGRLRRVGDGTNLIDTVYVENAAAAHLLAADALRPGSPVAGRAYFISQGEPVNCWAWIDELLAMAGLPPVRKSISLRAAWAVGAACEAAYWLLRLRGEPPMSRFLAAQMATSHYFDIARARRDFGYEPKISMAEGMRRLAAESGRSVSF